MSLALLLALALAPPNQEGGRIALPTAAAPQFHWVPEGVFVPYLPGCWRLRHGSDGLTALAATDEFPITDLEKCVASGVRFGLAERRVLDALPWRGDYVRLLTDEDGALTIETSTRRAWEALRGSHANPEMRWEPVRFGEQGNPMLGADGDRLVALVGRTLYRYEKGDWSSSTLDFLDGEYAAPASRVLLDGATLYVGTDKGEWGGTLHAVDLDTNAVTEISAPWSDGQPNVADLDRGPDGRIWATIGCIHMNGFGGLYVRSGTNWECVACTEYPSDPRGHDCAEQLEIMQATNHAGQPPWKLPPTGFIALDFDGRGRPYLLTETYGLFRREDDGRWTWITRGWPTWQAAATDLAIVGERAVISSRFAGVIVVDLDTLEARRVHIKS